MHEGISPPSRERTGSVLLEVLVAMTILGTAGVAITTLAVDSGRLVRHAQTSEANLRRANALLTSASLWTREDLDRHLGDRAQGPWRMTITVESPALYVVSLRDSAAETALLRTVLYRPLTSDMEPSDASR